MYLFAVVETMRLKASGEHWKDKVAFFSHVCIFTLYS